MGTTIKTKPAGLMFSTLDVAYNDRLGWPARKTIVETTLEGIGSLNGLLYKGYLYLDELGCYALGLRHYDPLLCRFWEPDEPDYIEPLSPAGLNLYAYCGNDPISYADPTGRAPDWVYWLVGGVALARAIALIAIMGESAAPILIGALIGALSGATFGGIEFKSGALNWSWQGAAKGFCWGAVIGAVGGAFDMGLSSFLSAMEITGVSSTTLQFISNGLTATGFSAFQASVEGEDWSLVRTGIAFAFGGFGSMFGKSIVSSALFGLGFSAAEGTIGETLDYYSLMVFPHRFWRWDFR